MIIKAKEEDLFKIDCGLPPVRDNRNTKKINLTNQTTPKQIFLSFNYQNEINNSPKHIRLPKPKKNFESRIFTKSQLSYLHDSGSNSPRIMNFPIDKDYFNKKIKKTVRNYFQIRRTSMGNNFNLVELLKETRQVEGAKSEMKNHKVTIELNPPNNIQDKSQRNRPPNPKVIEITETKEGKLKNDSNRNHARSMMNNEKISKEFENSKEVEKCSEFRISKFQNSLIKIPESEKTRVRTRNSGIFFKVDMGLQTEDLESRGSWNRRHQTKLSMYEIQDDLIE